MVSGDRAPGTGDNGAAPSFATIESTTPAATIGAGNTIVVFKGPENPVEGIELAIPAGTVEVGTEVRVKLEESGGVTSTIPQGVERVSRTLSIETSQPSVSSGSILVSMPINKIMSDVSTEARKQSMPYAYNPGDGDWVSLDPHQFLYTASSQTLSMALPAKSAVAFLNTESIRRVSSRGIQALGRGCSGTVKVFIGDPPAKFAEQAPSFRAALESAIGTWDSLLSDLRFQYVPASQAADLVIGWESLDKLTLGETFLPEQGKYEAWADKVRLVHKLKDDVRLILFNWDYTWNTPVAATFRARQGAPRDLESTALHELGHYLGLESWDFIHIDQPVQEKYEADRKKWQDEYAKWKKGFWPIPPKEPPFPPELIEPPVMRPTSSDESLQRTLWRRDLGYGHLAMQYCSTASPPVRLLTPTRTDFGVGVEVSSDIADTGKLWIPLVAQGGIRPYTWYFDGAGPVGLALDGAESETSPPRLSGKLAKPGRYTIRVKDVFGTVATDSILLCGKATVKSSTASIKLEAGGSAATVQASQEANTVGFNVTVTPAGIVSATPAWGSGNVRVTPIAQGSARLDITGDCMERVSIPITVLPATRQPGVIVGRVRDARTASAISGASVRVYRESTQVATSTSSADGAFRVTVAPGTGYRVVVSAGGYLDSTYRDVEVRSGQDANLEVTLQVQRSTVTTGSVTGRILHAFDRQPVGNLTVNLRAGLNVRSGPVAYAATTRTDGGFQFLGIAAGNYTVETYKSGFVRVFFSLTVIPGETLTKDEYITPVLEEGVTRIVLTWLVKPHDYDSHLTGPAADGGRFHTFYNSPDYSSGGQKYADLNHDDLTGDMFNEETTTLHRQLGGLYRFSVHDFDRKESQSSNDLADSGARVAVYRGGGDISAIFNVPPSREGTLWTVFELDGTVMTPINSMSYHSDQYTVQAGIWPATDWLLIQKLPAKDQRGARGRFIR